MKVFFKQKDFLHLKTPTLVSSPGVDHHIDFLQAHGCQTKRQWYLPTSPEIHLKKYLCQGYDRIFEIKNCFRDDLEGEHHKVEFSMLEWYRGFQGLESIENDLDELLKILVPLAPPLKKVRLDNVFNDRTHLKLVPETTKEELVAWSQQNGIETAADDDWNDVFFRIFMEKVEPSLGKDGPLLVTHFPAQQASLSQIDEQGWSQRFELYWDGVELANAYLEVNDPIENRNIFNAEQSMREQKKVVLAGWDEDFFDHLDLGMPPASGIALGLDRLYKRIKTFESN